MALAILSVGLAVTTSAAAAGLYQDGAGSRAASMGGTGTASANDPLSAVFDNPAALGVIDHPTIQIEGDGAVARGAFHNRVNDDADMNTLGALGAFAASVPWGPVHFGLGFNPDIAARVHSRYNDTPGGADGATTYGRRTNEAEITSLRSALAASWQITRTLSIGGNVALLYGENDLQTAYVFQDQPTLRTAKTLLNLDGDGFAWNAQAGLRWEPIPSVALSAVYTSRVNRETNGRATGNAGVQFANLGLGGARPDFAYDAEVDDALPQQVSAGVSWKATPSLTISGQFDWINWSDAFDTLRVRLTNGNNADLNGLLGSNRLNDDVPLHWRDQYVERVGVEQRFGEHWSVRGGYAYSNNPVPDGTLTPLNAAITEHLLTAGLGYQRGPVQVDAYYQWQLPATARVGRSALASGEYSDSVTEVNVQRFGVAVTYAFGGPGQKLAPPAPKDAALK